MRSRAVTAVAIAFIISKVRHAVVLGPAWVVLAIIAAAPAGEPARAADGTSKNLEAASRL
jgi:hypothetical protein